SHGARPRQVRDGGAPPPLRSRRMGRVARHHPVLYPRDLLRGPGTLDPETAMSKLSRSGLNSLGRRSRSERLRPKVRREADRPGNGDALPRSVAIFGFARSGQALSRALAQRGVALTVGEEKSRS